MRRRTALIFLAPLVALSLLGAGCGGSDSSAGTDGSSSGPASSDDPAVILGSIEPGNQTSPQTVSVSIDVDLDGQIDNPQAAALLGDGPISVSLSGPVDPAAKTAQLDFSFTAGKLNLPGQLRMVDGGKAYVQLNDKWYEVDPSSLPNTDTPVGDLTTDPQSTLEQLGDPSEFLDNATVVGGETIDGIDTDHVRGDINVEGLLTAVQQASGGSNGPSESDIQQAKDIIKSGTVDVWVGKDTKQVHRMTLDLDISVPADQQSSTQGIEGMRIQVTIQQTPIDSVSVETPDNPLSADQLNQDLGTILLANLGSSG